MVGRTDGQLRVMVRIGRWRAGFAVLPPSFWNFDLIRRRLIDARRADCWLGIYLRLRRRLGSGVLVLGMSSDSG